jgi:MFS family permease
LDSLWRNHQFLRLWFSSVISALGSKVTSTALPLTAAVTLGASPPQMAALVIAGQLPDVLFGLPAGSWIDRGHHRLFLAGSEASRALLLAAIPITAFFGLLSLPVLMAVAFLAGVTTVFSSVASVAVLPSIVRSDQIVEANARLSVAGSVVSLAGPGLAGALIQLVSAPKAILFDALSNVASALSLRGVGVSGRLPGAKRSLARDIKEGLRELIATPVLRALTISSAVFAVGLAMNSTILMLYLTRELALSPATIGICLAVGGAGTLLGSAVAKRVSNRVGMGRAIIGGTLIEAIAAIVIPLSVFLANPVPALIAGQLLNGIGISVYSINHVSLRQKTVRPEFLGRITAGRRFLTFSVAPAGAALGGWIGQLFGLTAAMAGSAVMLLAGTLVMWASPVRRT